MLRAPLARLQTWTDPYPKGLAGTDILPVPSLPGLVRSRTLYPLQALAKEVQVEENVVSPSEAGIQGQQHQRSEGIRRTADVDDWRGRERENSWVLDKVKS